MDAFKTADLLTSFWGRSHEAALQVQSSMLRGTAHFWPTGERGTLPQDAVVDERLPDDEATRTARETFERAWSAANELVREQAAAALALHSSGLPGDGPDSMGQLLDPAAWLGRTIGADDTPEAGRLGTNRLDAMVRDVQIARAALDRQSLLYEAALLDAWTRAWRTAAENSRATTLEERAPPAAATRTASASRAMANVLASGDVASKLRDLLAAAGKLRAAQRSVGDALASLYGVPTRTEIDDLYVELDALRREVRRLRASGTCPPERGACEASSV